MINTTAAIILGFILDAILGDPSWAPHPARLMGRLISGTEKYVRDKFKGNLIRAGYALVIIVCLVCTVIPALILIGAGHISPYLRFALEAVMCYQLLAAKCLSVESMKVYGALRDNDLDTARKDLSMIVGRDTQTLDEEEISRAAVETVAENASDGVIAPIFYIALGGPVFAFFYKAVNTMDSMVGYKNEKYLDLGRAAAKLDDIVNFLPARISALLMVISSAPLGYDMKNAYKIWKRDRRNHSSPNSAQTEAACAGALNIQLGGDSRYFGRLVSKPTIGDRTKEIEKEDIIRANRLMRLSSLCACLIAVALRTVAALII